MESGTVRPAVYVFLCGLLIPLGFAPLGWYLIPILSIATFFLTLYYAEKRRRILLGWLFGLGQFGAGVSWVMISIHLYGSDAGLSLSVLVMFLLVATLALYPALIGWIASRFGSLNPESFFIVLLPSSWLMTEWLRSWLFTGFPWLNLGYSQIDSPLSGYAPIIGVYGVGWLSALSAGLIACLWFLASRKKIFAVASLLAIWLCGALLGPLKWTTSIGEPLNVAVVQGNISQDLKWKPDQRAATLALYVDQTEKNKNADLVVWPETAIPDFYDHVESDFLRPLAQKLREQNTSLLTGVPLLDREDGWQYYNTVISLDELGAFYKKVHLVPFGEYLPLRDWLARTLAFLPIPESDFSSGSVDQPLLYAAGYPIGVSICYEVAFGEQIIQGLPEAALLVNVSNDAWFGDSLAPHQHLEMARMRALETGRYLLRATNTGISAIIDHQGDVKAQSQQFKTQTIRADIQARTGSTPYVLLGNFPVILLGGVVLTIGIFRGRKSV